MGPIVLDFKDWLTIVTGLVTFTGVFVTLRATVSKLESGQTEVLRQLGALHKRLDHHGERITKAEVKQAVLEERVENLRPLPGLRDSQRFRLRVQPEELVEVDASSGIPE